MNKILNKLNSFSKAVAKKLNNFRLTSIILASVSLVAGIISLGLLFIYYFAGDVSTQTQSRQPSFTSLGASGRILGMVFFLFAIFVIILSIVIIYNVLPNIQNKEKVSPSKAPLVMGIVNGGLELVVLVFAILAITIDKHVPNTLALYIVAIPFVALTAIANILCIFPLVKCVFYQPSIGSKLCPKKQAEAEAKAE